MTYDPNGKSIEMIERKDDAIDPSTIFLIDGDIDGSRSLLKMVIKDEDSAFSHPSEVVGLIRKIPDHQTIRLVVNTKGGDLVNIEKILRVLLKHPTGYVVYVKSECYSAGALLTLGAKEIVMTDNSFLGKIDPQTTDHQQCTVYAVLDDIHVGAKNAYQVKASRYVLNYIDRILRSLNLREDILDRMKEKLLWSELPHEASFDRSECADMGLNVRPPSEDEEVYFRDQVIRDYRLKVSGTSKNARNLIFWLLVVLFALIILYVAIK